MKTPEWGLLLLDQAQFLGQSTVTHLPLPLVSTRLAEIYTGITPIVDGEDNTRGTEWDLVKLSNVGLLVDSVAETYLFPKSKIRTVEIPSYRSYSHIGQTASA